VHSRLLFVLCMFSVSLSACAQGGPGSFAVATSTAVATASTESDDGHRPHAGMLRWPDVSATHITFVYADDLWLVPREGGLALPLAGPPGPEIFPRFSPDGKTIGFVGNYEGNRDLYTIPTEGGISTRITHHPSAEFLCGWTPDGKLLFFFSGLAGLQRQNQLFTVSPEGGLPEKLPVPYGTHGAISPDGQWLAYTPYTRDYATWKRYRGGMASDIWLFNLDNHTSKQITDWEGTDSQPMWHGQTLYYMSDAGPEHRLNIWSYDVVSGKRKQITHLTDYDVKWPAIGPGPDGKGEIVFQNGPELLLLDLASGQSRAVDVLIPGDRPTIRPKTVDAKELITGWDISSTGKRGVVEARGDIWTIPAKKGSPRNLTHTSGSAERQPSWSPDGQWIAYFSDETGEYELYITQSDGKGEARQLTSDGKVFRLDPTWSPDSKHITFTDKTGALYLHTIESEETKPIDVNPWGLPGRQSWSSDSAWIAYTKAGDSRVSSIWLYEVESGAKHQLTSGMFNDTWPTFDRKGDYLFFASNRDFTSPRYEDIGTTFIYADTDVLLAVPLRDEVGSPWAPKSDEEEWGEEDEEDKEGEESDEGDKEDKDDGDGEKEADDDEVDDEEGADGSEAEKADDEQADKDDEEAEEDEEEELEPVIIELEDFERRAIPLPVKRGGFVYLAVNHEGKLVYTRIAPRGPGDKPSIKIFDLKDEEKEEKTVLGEVGPFAVSADGKKLLVRKEGTMAIIDAAPDQKLDKPMSLAGMNATIDPRAEWRQIFNEVWRIQRDYFYDPNMHGVDWEAMRERYGRMLDDCVSRGDVSFVIGELIAELNVGHAYVLGSGDSEKQPRISVGMLGADFELHDGAYRISKIHEGAPWDYDARGPLSQPGVDAKEGDYLLAVNGTPVDVAKDPWAAFQGLDGRVTALTVSEKPVIDDDAREILVEPAGSESDLRFRAWVEKNRAYVEQQSDGRVGYIYVPDTGTGGQNELFRQFFGQRHREALIIDERWNGGGQIPTRFIELLNRPVTNYWARRDGRDGPWPPDAHQGPKCMLINGLAGSGGDCFPYYFRQAGLGKLIGRRTWGGLVGISGNPGLIDGGFVSVPTFAFYETDGTWGVEGHGVEPDIEVIDDPALMVDGGDPQLDAAIQHMLNELKRRPYTPPKRPAYPDRSGMGIREQDK
jgi:tricorn protease